MNEIEQDLWEYITTAFSLEFQILSAISFMKISCVDKKVGFVSLFLSSILLLRLLSCSKENNIIIIIITIIIIILMMTMLRTGE